MMYCHKTTLCYLCLLALKCCFHTYRQEHFPLRPQTFWHSVLGGQLLMEAVLALCILMSSRPGQLKKHVQTHSMPTDLQGLFLGCDTRARSAEHSVEKAPAHFPEINYRFHDNQNTIEIPFLFLSDWTRWWWVYIIRVIFLKARNSLLSTVSLKSGQSLLYNFVLLCTLFCIDDNAGRQMDWQNASLLALRKAEHGHGEIIITDCCGDLQLPRKQAEPIFSLSFTELWNLDFSKAGTLLKAFQLACSWQHAAILGQCLTY